ncbi:MAG: haloalkane dehalogenase [bacterium]|nr:haloalkane dehalogenase [bacterium]
MKSKSEEALKAAPRRSVVLALLLAGCLLLAPGCLNLMALMAPGIDDVEEGISAEFPYESKFIAVKESRMHYVEAGQGDPILLVHGNPTSSYLWRNIIPHLKDQGRVIAVDLIGMGKSDKPELEYKFADHAEYLSEFIRAMGLKNITLVLHDWGGGVGTDYAVRNLENLKGVVYMEAVMKPMSWEAANAAEQYLFGRLRDPEDGHQIAAVDNFFVEKMLPMMSGREFSPEEMQAYREPFPTVASRKPVAQWPREIPFIEEGPDRNVKRIGDNYRALQAADVPLLLLYAKPGVIVKADFLEELKSDLPRMSTAFVGSGLHYLQEAQPTKIGTEIAAWLQKI